MVEYVRWFRELADSQEDWAKQLKLGELYVAGFPIPSGFIILSSAFKPDTAELSEQAEQEIAEAYRQLHASYPTQQVSQAAKAMINFGRNQLALLVRLDKGKTIPNVIGEEALLSAIKECLSEPPTGSDISSNLIIVQKMVNPLKSGIVQPAGDNFLVKASYGFAGPIVRGQVDTDEYAISKSGQVVQKKLGAKESALIIDQSTRELRQVNVNISQRDRFALHDRELEVIAKLANKLNEHLGQSQLVQWAIEGHRVYVLDFEPAAKAIEMAMPEEAPSEATADTVTTELPGLLPPAQEGKPLAEPSFEEPFLPSKYLLERNTGERKISEGEEPFLSEREYLPEKGGVTEGLAEGQGLGGEGLRKTGTGIGVVIDMRLYAERAARANPDMVLLRLEPLILNAGISPLNRGEYISNIARGVQAALEAFPDKEMQVCLPDIRSDQLDEGLEKNPMLGWHGARRMGSEHIDSELQAVKQAVQASGHRNVRLLLPFVTHQSEVKKAEDMMFKHGLSNQIKLGVVIETPAAVHIADLLCERADFIIADIDHLTEFLLAVDRRNEKVAQHYNSKHPAVLKALSAVAKACKESNTKFYVCGEAVSESEMVDFLVKNRVDGLLTSAEKLASLRSEIFRAERKLLLDVAADKGQDF